MILCTDVHFQVCVGFVCSKLNGERLDGKRVFCAVWLLNQSNTSGDIKIKEFDVTSNVCRCHFHNRTCFILH